MSTRNVYTPVFRVSFPNIFKPKRNTLNNKDEYSLVALFTPDFSSPVKLPPDYRCGTKEDLQKAFNAAVQEQWGANPPKNIRKPFRNQGDRAKENEQGKLVMPDGYVDGAIYINFKSNRKPGLVNQQAKTIIDETEFYAGCYAVATFNAVAYDLPQNKGVSFYLVNLQKVGEGEPFGNLSKPEDSFKPIEDSSSSLVGSSSTSINDLL